MGSSGSSIGEHRCGEWINCRCFCPNGDEEVYLKVEVNRIHISEKGTIFYDIRSPEGGLMRVAENKLYKTPANDVGKEMLKKEAKK